MDTSSAVCFAGFCFNFAENILRVGLIDRHGEATKSQAAGDSEPKILTDLQKTTNGYRSGQVTR